jgi:hypothetical protein
MQAASTSTSTWERPPTGTFPARISRIVDIGKQHGDYKGKATLNQKLLVTFELTGPCKTNGRPFEISAVVTKSKHENAQLTKWIEACLGHSQIDDLERILDKPVLVTIISAISKTTGTEKSYLNCNSVRALPDGMHAEPLECEAVAINFPKTKKEFDSLTSYERIKIEASPDWKIKATAEEDFVKRTLAKEKARAENLDPELAHYQRLLHG